MLGVSFISIYCLLACQDFGIGLGRAEGHQPGVPGTPGSPHDDQLCRTRIENSRDENAH